MRIHSSILLVVLLRSNLALYDNAAFAQLKAFPEAEGYGALVTGGRGGTVYHVTNLNNSGAGSLRDAVSQPNRIVVFDTSGVINITSQLVFSSNITVAGQTAPGGGITVYNNSVSLSSVNGICNDIIRDIRFHAGMNSSSGAKALSVTDGNNVIYDHVSVEWGRWDDIGVTKSTGTAGNVTFQNCIIGEPINPQYFGGLFENVDNVTFSHNLFVDNTSRSPKVKGTIQYFNNVVYNWAVTGLCGGHSGADHYLDCIGNTFIAGPSSNNQFVGEFTATDHVYQTGNVKDLNKNGVPDSVAVVPSDFYQSTTYPGPTFSSSSTLTYQPAIPVTIDSAATAYAKVLAGAGASLVRDPVDTRLVGQLTSLGTSGNARVLDETVVGGQPAMTVVTRPGGFDSDNDGIPNTWESAHGLNPNLASDAKLLNPIGYTYVEQYINELASVHAGRTWNSNGGDWSTLVKWTTALPTNDDNAYVAGNGAGSNGLVTVTQNNAACFYLHIGGNGSPSGEKVTVRGGALTVNDTIYVGDQNNGTLEIQSGGTVQAWNVQLGNTVGGTAYTGNLLLRGGVLMTYQVVPGGGTPGNWTSGGSCTWSGSTLQAIGTLNFAVPATIGAGGATIDSNGFACTVSGVLSGDGGLTKTGSGTLVLTAANTYAGPTVISKGTLELTSTGQIAAASDINISDSTAVFQVDSGTHTVGNINGTGTIILLTGCHLTASSVAQKTLIINDGATLTIAAKPGSPTAGRASPQPVP